MYDEVNSTLISIDVQSDLVVVANNLIYKDVADMWVREGLTYRWVNVQPGFEMPLKVELNGSMKLLHFKTIWTQFFAESKRQRLLLNPNFI
jgi:hypothetical protein